MADLAKHITDEKNGLTYTLHGDYYFPEIIVPEEKRCIGKYGMMRQDYLEQHRPGLYTRLLLSGKLPEHLADVSDQAQERLGVMIPQMAKAEGVTESMKAANPMRWVGMMNIIHQRAEEIVLNELVYG